MVNIKVVDSIMGSGKTEWSIEMINNDTQFDRHFLFVTPYLDEVKRIKRSCEIKNFYDPKIFNEDDKTVYKRDHFKKLLSEGRNIVTTHNLFKIIDKEAIDILYINNYTLILDEVMNVIEELKISPKDVEMLKEKWLLVDKTGKIAWDIEREKKEKYTGVFNKVRELALNGNLVLFKDRILLWRFPIEVFNAFDDIFILTYLFDGQPQRYYYDMCQIPYEKYQVQKNTNTSQSQFGNKYKLIPFDVHNEDNIKNNLLSKIHIYEGTLNKIGEKDYSLSKSWYEKDTRYKCKLMQNNILNYFCHKMKTKSNENMWTTFKQYQGKLKGKGYTKGFVSCSARATNQFADKKFLAYSINRFESPILINYFKEKGNISVDQDLYALSEFVQWIWRSAIRNNEEIWLYVPSLRMRDLIKDWLTVANVATESNF